MNTRILKYSIGAAACLTAVMAQAVPVIEWNAVNDSTFVAGSVVPNAGISYSPKSLRWPVGGSVQSGLDILDAAAPVSLFTDGAANGPLVGFRHINNPLPAGNATLQAVTIANSLTLTPVNPAGPQFGPVTIDFDVFFVETPNGGTNGVCADGTTPGVGLNINGCADIFVLSGSALNFEFDYDGETYFYSAFETTSGLNPLPDQACFAAGAAAGCLGFRTAEQVQTDVFFSALITTVPVGFVPEPGSLALVGLVLTGMAAGRRRGKKAVR